MRAPLMSMCSMLELLHTDLAGRLDSDQDDMLRTAVGASTRLTDMVSAVLDVSRLENKQMPVRKQTCDLCEVVRQALHTLTGLTRQDRVVWDAPTGVVNAVCDPEITERIVINLVSNALRFTPAAGHIYITVARVGEGARFSVRDMGPGIPREFHEKIFEKFGQLETRRPGTKYSTGLGLAFCRLAVEAQSGLIGVDSAEAQGSTFWFCLPAAATAGAA
jgi:signal transduction histidine kinase